MTVKWKYKIIQQWIKRIQRIFGNAETRRVLKICQWKKQIMSSKLLRGNTKQVKFSGINWKIWHD